MHPGTLVFALIWSESVLDSAPGAAARAERNKFHHLHRYRFSNKYEGTAGGPVATAAACEAGKIRETGAIEDEGALTEEDSRLDEEERKITRLSGHNEDTQFTVDHSAAIPPGRCGDVAFLSAGSEE